MPMHIPMDGVLDFSRPAVGALDALAGVARDGPDAAIERSLAAARELLGMQLAYVAEVGEDELRFVALDGDAGPFGAPASGTVLPRLDTLCDRMLRGQIGNVIADVATTPGADDAGSVGVGAYVGVPLRLADGTVYGSLCCVSDHAEPALQEHDARLLDVLARLIADQIDRERAHRRAARLAGEATAGQALLAALKGRERYGAEHAEAVLELSTAVARRLGLADAEIVQVAQVALLHDVGKLGVPEAILQKPGPLTDAEWRIVRAHPAIGERLVASIASLAHLAPAVRAEHERWDGTGYPDGLTGAEIPLASRICLACDAWHAMTSDRPYRPALSEDEARAELRRHAGTQFCPRTVDALLAVLEGQPRIPAPAPAAAPDRAAQPESELRALIAVAGAVAAAHRLEDVLEVVGEETCRVVGASSVSISRWEREHDRVRTLINVGELGPGEERFPTGEIYALADYPLAARLLREGESYVISRGDRTLGDHDRQLLDALDKGSYIGVPVIFDGRTWGKLEAFANVGAVPFTRRHVPFLEAIAGQVGAAIGRAELFSRVNALAYSDPLTGLGNRRALDERLEAAVERGGELAIAFCDVDGLKQINDTRGHGAGDDAIRRAADALASAAHGHAGASVCRVGGDEFCVVLEGGDAAAVAAIVRAAGAALANEDQPVSLSCGAAALRPGMRAADLFRASDAAQYAAKRRGHGRVALAGEDAPAPGDRRARRHAQT
jgi:diguanylate cyclase (GGDEF)-like protein